MEQSKQVRISELREAINRILDFVERDLGKEVVELSHNFYWNIDEKELYAMDHPPKDHDCGSLVDDWEFVTAGLGDSTRALPIMFIHIAPILRSLAFSVPSFPPPKPGQKTP